MKKLIIFPLLLLFLSCKNGSELNKEKPENRPYKEFITDFSNITVPKKEILSGGPSKDGIPALDNPVFTGVEEADKTIGDREPVIVVIYRKEIKIYPVQIIIWHEIVNDNIDNLPIAVTYCPLCNTGIVFESRIENRDLTFGTTGRLRFSNLIMYDRQTETWWQQATGEGIAGKYSGFSLKTIPSLFMSWNDAVKRYPEALVLSSDTGWDRPYGNNPYSSYDTGYPFLYKGTSSPKTAENLNPLDRVLLVKYKTEVRYYSYKSLRKNNIINDRIGNKNIVVIWKGGTASALDTSTIEEGRDVGSANAFLASIENLELDFYFDNNLIKDKQTNSVWDFTGDAVSGMLKGKKLEPLMGTQHFWFSASAFFPIEP